MNKLNAPINATALLSVLILVAGAVILRFWGLDWAIPNGSKLYPYHPDEAVMLDAATRVNPLWGNLTPGFYNYGSLTVLLTRFAHDVLAPLFGWGTLPQPDAPFRQWVDDMGMLLLVGRGVSLVLGLGTIWAVWKLGERLYGGRTGIIAAAFLAVAPMHALLGHYFAVDVPAAFFTTLALLLATLALRAEGRKALGWCAAAGLAAGLATGTKYNSFPVLLSVLVPVWVMWRADEGKSRTAAITALVAAAVACIAGFLIATPGALLQTGPFLKAVAYELGRNREGQGLVFRATLPAPLYHLGISLPVGLEWPLYLLSMAGVAWAMRRRQPEDWLLLLFVVPFFLMLAPAERKFVRYVVPLLPPLALLAGRLVDEGLRLRAAPVWGTWAAAAFLAALASTTAHLGVLSSRDVRDSAASYVWNRADGADIVALGGDAWYYTPPLHPTAGCVKAWLPYGGPPIWDRVGDGEKRSEVARIQGFRILAPQSYPNPEGALSLEKFRRHRPMFVVLTDYEYEDPERIKRAEPSFEHGILSLMQAMKDDGYQVQQEFRPRPSLLGFTWWKHGTPPHDWRYFMPTIRVYARPRDRTALHKNARGSDSI